MQMLKKLFNSDSKFHLELDEIKESEVVQTAVKTASKATEVVKEKASEVADSQPVKEAITKTKDALDIEKSDEAKADKAKAKDTTTAKSEQNGKQTESTSEQADTPAKPEASGASSYEPPFWVAAMYNNSSSKNSNGRVAEETFATDNLMPIMTKYRRRPGGSLKKFKDMAKQAKTPKG